MSKHKLQKRSIRVISEKEKFKLIKWVSLYRGQNPLCKPPSPKLFTLQFVTGAKLQFQVVMKGVYGWGSAQHEELCKRATRSIRAVEKHWFI